MPIVPQPPRDAVILAEIKQGSLREFKHWLDDVYRLVNAISDAGVDVLAFSSVEQGGGSSNTLESRVAVLETAALSIQAPPTEEVRTLKQRVESLEVLLLASVQDGESVNNLTRRLDNIEALVSEMVQYDAAAVQRLKADLDNLMTLQISEVIV